MAQMAARALRQAILVVFLLGLVGSAVELLLLGHYEDVRQTIPLVLSGVSLVALAAFGATGAWLALRAFQGTMLLFVVSGAVGVWLHFQANREFQLEVNPSLSGWALVSKALQAKTPPALAPGVMVQLGLLGLAYTCKHPRASGPQ
jgi:hypothetical protein